MNLGRSLFAVLFVLRAVPAAADSLTDLFPPDTHVVFGIRVHNLAISSVVQTFAAEAKAAAAGWIQSVPLDGFDLLRDIDEVLIASTGKGENTPTIIVVTGRFDVTRLAQGAKKYYRDVPLLGGDKESNGAVALLAPGTALVGDAGLIRAAIDRRGGNTRIDAALNDRITSLRQRYDIWGLGEKLEGFVPPAPQSKVLESIDRFQFGIQLANGLELGAEIHTRSPEDAEKLSAQLGMIAAMLKGAQPSMGGAKFDLKAEGGTLKLNVFVPDEVLKKAIQAQAAALSPAPGHPARSSALTVTASPAEAGPSAAPAKAAPAAAAKPAVSKAPDKDRDTVVFTLPGKK